MINRRTAIKVLALSSGAAALSLPQVQAQKAGAASSAGAAEGTFKLPPLPYAADALEPYIDAQTMTIHHDKHHQAYVTKLNEAVAKLDQKPKSIEQLLSNIDALPEAVRKDVRNQGGGHANHTLFWQMLKKSESGRPVGQVAKEIEKSFGSYDDFWKMFSESATKVFGSGWAWLVWRDGKLAVESTANQDSPIMTGAVPLLGLDVWEHAYYLKYQNKRADYIAAFQKVINWDFVNERLNNAGKA